MASISSPPVIKGVRVTRSLVLCICFVDRCHFVLFALAIVLSVLLRYTDSDYPFDIFNLLFDVLHCKSQMKYNIVPYNHCNDFLSYHRLQKHLQNVHTVTHPILQSHIPLYHPQYRYMIIDLTKLSENLRQSKHRR